MADIIQLLPESIANQIAAGEVVQRPASVVKELLENSIDAGSTQIKLIIKDSGKTLIQVIDNGCGMSETDARMSFERHATSKIRSAQDLFSIRTMGFRGEAMASIAAVAQVEMRTRLHKNELLWKCAILWMSFSVWPLRIRISFFPYITTGQKYFTLFHPICGSALCIFSGIQPIRNWCR